jgi:Tol biopolymer transport system component
VLESPSWSPDGKHIVFSAGMDNNSDLFIINLATKEIYPLLDTTAYLTDPNWSAADNMIYYSSNEDGNFNIFRVTPEGDSPERVLDFPSAEYYPSKSSDGKYLIFQSNMSGKRDIYRVQMDDLSLLRLSREQYDLTRPKWRPLHNEVSYIHVETSFFTTYYFKLLQVDNLSVIIYHTLMHDVINSNSRYDWSPDGSLIVFSGNYLCIFNASMQEMSGLSCDYKGAVFPSWSPILLEE